MEPYERSAQVLHMPLHRERETRERSLPMPEVASQGTLNELFDQLTPLADMQSPGREHVIVQLHAEGAEEVLRYEIVESKTVDNESTFWERVTYTTLRRAENGVITCDSGVTFFRGEWEFRTLAHTDKEGWVKNYDESAMHTDDKIITEEVTTLHIAAAAAEMNRRALARRRRFAVVGASAITFG